jgi:hypothetical protein
VLGFLLPTLPWAIFASHQYGRLIAIEDVGAHGLAVAYPGPYAEVKGDSSQPVVGLRGLRVIGRAFAEAPSAFAGNLLERVSGLFHVEAGRWLFVDRCTRSRTAARRWTRLVRLGDVVFVIVMLAAPFGVALSPQRGVALLPALWLLLHVAITAAVGYTGVRFRAPIDAILIAFGAVALVPSAWRAASLPRLVAAGAVSALVAVPLLGSLPASAALPARYGTGRWMESDGKRVTNLFGDAGFNVPSPGGELQAEFWRGLDGRGDVSLRVLIDGEVAGTLTLPEGERGTRVVRGRARGGGTSWVEVQCLRCEGGRRLVSIAVGGVD